MGATIWATAFTSLIAGTATLLFSAYHFQQTAPLGVLGNVLVLPVVSIVIMPFALLSVLAMPFGIEAPFVVVMGWSIDRMVELALGSWPAGATGLDASNPLLAPIAACCIGLAALAWFTFLNTWLAPLLAPVLLLPLILLFGLDRPPDVLIADTTQAVALRGDTALELVAHQGRRQLCRRCVARAPIRRSRNRARRAEVRQRRVRSHERPINSAVAVSAQCSWLLAEDCGPARPADRSRGNRPSKRAPVGTMIDAGDAGGRRRALAAVGRERQGGFDIRTAIPNLTRPWRVVPP
jgi:competence protein ComEC